MGGPANDHKTVTIKRRNVVRIHWHACAESWKASTFFFLFFFFFKKSFSDSISVASNWNSFYRTLWKRRNQKGEIYGERREGMKKPCNDILRETMSWQMHDQQLNYNNHNKARRSHDDRSSLYSKYIHQDSYYVYGISKEANIYLIGTKGWGRCRSLTNGLRDCWITHRPIQATSSRYPCHEGLALETAASVIAVGSPLAEATLGPVPSFPFAR